MVMAAKLQLREKDPMRHQGTSSLAVVAAAAKTSHARALRAEVMHCRHVQHSNPEEGAPITHKAPHVEPPPQTQQQHAHVAKRRNRCPR